MIRHMTTELNSRERRSGVPPLSCEKNKRQGAASTSQAANRLHQPPENTGGTLCDIANGHAFVPQRVGPPVPVLAAFGVDGLHQCTMLGSWDFERVVGENPEALVRSRRTMGPTGTSEKWKDVIIQIGERAYLCGDETRIVGYAATHEEAGRIVREFKESYGSSPLHPGGSFQLIRKERYDDIKCENVPLGADPEISYRERKIATLAA